MPASDILAARRRRAQKGVRLLACAAAWTAASAFAAPPRILLHPVDQNVVTGDTARFATASDPSSPASFQWFQNGDPIPGAVSPVLVIRNSVPRHHGRYHAVIRNADGESHTRFAILHLHDRQIGPGVTDTEFLAPLFTAGSEGAALAVSADGSLLVGGNFELGGNTARHLVRLHPDGALDASFPPHLRPPDDQVRCLAALPDGSILVAGDFTSINGAPCFRIAKLRTDGSLDPAFRRDRGTDNDITALAILDDGKILIGGKFLRILTDAGWVDQPYLARLRPDGSIDPGFASAPVSGGPVLALASQPADGKILAGGSFTHAGGASYPRLARLMPDGSVDNTFFEGSGPNLQVRTIAADSAGRILIGGDFTILHGVRRDRLARLNPDGSIDLSFNAPCSLPVRCLAALPDSDAILVGGRFTEIGGESFRRIARLNPSGSIDTAFDAYGLDEEVRAFAVTDGGRKVIAAGDFMRPHSGVVRLHLAPDSPESPPAILARPAPVTLPESDSLCLSVIARAKPDPDYQWRFNGSPIEGARSSQLIIADADAGDAGFYDAAVTNAKGSTSSAPVRIDTTPRLPGRSTRHTVVTRPDTEIPPGQTTIISLDVAESFALNAVRAEISLSHPHTDLLDIDLIAPHSAVAELFDGDDKSGRDLIAAAFDDASPIPIGEAQPPFVGTFRPEEPLSEFFGAASNGIWRLRIRDDRVSGPPGTLREFRLDLVRPAPAITFENYASLVDIPPNDPEADLNHDGFSNLAAFAFASDPRAALQPLAVRSDRSITFRHWSLPAPFTYSVEHSRDLSAWSPAPAISYTISLPDRQSITTLTPADTSAGYFRITATPNP